MSNQQRCRGYRSAACEKISQNSAREDGVDSTFTFFVGFAALALGLSVIVNGQSRVVDCGVRGGDSGAGGPVPGLTPLQMQYFKYGKSAYEARHSVAGTIPGEPKPGLGPVFDSNSCSSCHSQPATGGSSPLPSRTTPHPEIAAGTDAGARNYVPSFILPDGPARVARFVTMPDGVTPDGSVHELFVISGRRDASGCSIAQPDFDSAMTAHNVTFRIPVPTFGAGLMETVSESEILRSFQNRGVPIAYTLARPDGAALWGAPTNGSAGIAGAPNRTKEGTIGRFGWKAQDKSVLQFAGEASVEELGGASLSNETPACASDGTPGTGSHSNQPLGKYRADVQLFALFMRMLAAPASAIPPDITPGGVARGRQRFITVGCANCHLPSYTTGSSATAALSNQQVNLFSDLLLHHMGPNLADRVMQGLAGGDQFRTAPLWGVGQRAFFLHDGRAMPTNGGLVDAIKEHFSHRGTIEFGGGTTTYGPSEANAVISNFNALSVADQQDVVDFLRSL